jgi:C-terminal processing protease CtpA/Prc
MPALVVVVCLAAGLSAQQPPPKTISNFDRGASLTMLKQVKIDLKENYYDTAFRGMDVEKTFAEAEQRLRNAGSVNETVATIAEVLMRLNDSHTIFIPPDRAARVTYGWRASIIGGVPYVVGVLPGSDADKKGLAPGDRLLAWNRYEPTRENLWQIYYLYNFIRPQQLQRLVVQKPDGAEKTLDIASKVEPRERMDLIDLANMLMDVLEKTDDQTGLAGDTFVWKYTAFADPKDVDRVMKKARTAKALVLDMRGNAGGNVEAMRSLVSWLFDHDVHLADEKTRKGDKPLDAKARKDAFTGKLVVLVDSRSASAAEMVGRIVQLEKRGAVIGDRTMGAVMTARMFPHRLGSEESMAFYFTTITIGDVRMSDGATLEHKGLTPDETVLPSGADLAAKRDPALARAIALLGGTMTAEEAGRFYR